MALFPTWSTISTIPQVLRRINPNALLSLFWLQLGQTKRPHCMLAQLHPQFRVLQQGKCLSYPPDCMDWVTETPLTRGQRLLKFHPYSLFRPKGGRKTINLFTHFHGLMPNNNYKHLQCFVMLETHSETHRGQMSHICDISTLRVNLIN